MLCDLFGSASRLNGRHTMQVVLLLLCPDKARYLHMFLPLESGLALQEALIAEFGPYIPVSRVWRQLSYPSLEAARKGFARKTAPLSGVKLPGRRGVFVRSADLAAWLDGGRTQAVIAAATAAA